MNKICIFLLSFTLLLTSCGGDPERKVEVKNWMEHNDKIKILTTTAMIADLVTEIVKDKADVLVLIKGELDPHSYQLVKGDDEKLRAAELIFANGLGLEHGASLQKYLQNNDKVIELGNCVFKTYPEAIIYLKGELDPHIWMDISLWSKTVPFIVEALIAKFPENAQAFQDNGLKLKNEMVAKHGEVRQLLLAIPEERRYLVTSHDAFNYFTRAYLAEKDETCKEAWQKRFAAPEGLAPDSQLNPLDIQAIIDHLKCYKINVVFPESNVSRDSIRKIVSAGKEKGLDLRMASDYLYGDAMGGPGSEGETYLKMILHNAKTIAHYLKSDS